MTKPARWGFNLFYAFGVFASMAIFYAIYKYHAKVLLSIVLPERVNRPPALQSGISHNQSPLHFGQCGDPYLAPGLWTKNGDDLYRNYYTPLDKTCSPPPNFLSNVVEQSPLSFLQGRTVLLIGDSIEWNAYKLFCDLWPTNESNDTELVERLRLQFSEDVISKTQLMDTRVCRVEKYDFELLFLWIVGMTDDEIWKHKGYSPASIRARTALIEMTFRLYPRTPDIVLLGSGLWDLASYVRWEAQNFVAPQAEMRKCELERWLDRADEFVDRISALFPSSVLFWRWLHVCRADIGNWFSLAVSEVLDRTVRQPWHPSRIHQMNDMYELLLSRKPRLQKFAWGEILNGHAENYQDAIHPDTDARLLYCNMILYYLSIL